MEFAQETLKNLHEKPQERKGHLSGRSSVARITQIGNSIGKHIFCSRFRAILLANSAAQLLGNWANYCRDAGAVHFKCQHWCWTLQVLSWSVQLPFDYVIISLAPHFRQKSFSIQNKCKPPPHNYFAVVFPQQIMAHTNKGPNDFWHFTLSPGYFLARNGASNHSRNLSAKYYYGGFFCRWRILIFVCYCDNVVELR